MQLAVWSGPRNLSTALMYSFAQRSDFEVWDEPFYAAYLDRTGLQHPMRDEILAVGETSAERVVAKVTAGLGEGPHLYQKHMTQHMLPEFDRGWLREVTNVFLIRHPARVIASYAAKREDPTLEDIGFRQQVELFDLVADRGQKPVVLDSADIRAQPEAMLRRLCGALDLAFDPAMLSWPPGGNPADGVWGTHWYGAVHRSTGFAGAEGPLPQLSGAYAALVEDAMQYYDRLLPQAKLFSGD